MTEEDIRVMEGWMMDQQLLEVERFRLKREREKEEREEKIHVEEKDVKNSLGAEMGCVCTSFN